MNHRNKWAIVAALLLALAGCKDAAPVDACGLQKPPSSALKLEGRHGMFGLVYPPALPAQYTGCQVTWLGNVHKLLEVRFNNGNVVSVEAYEPDEPVQRCAFDEHGALRSGNPEMCGTSSQWIHR